MTCRKCRRPTKVVGTMSFPGRTERTRECQCGITFSTIERIDRRSIRPTRGIMRLPVTEAMRAHVFERDGHRCSYCGSGSELVVDHVLPFVAPIEEGRTIEAETTFRNSVENMCCCCRECNASKGDSVHWQRGRKGPSLPHSYGTIVEDVEFDPELTPEDPDLYPGSPENPERARVRGPAKSYSSAFQQVWAVYQRHQEKGRAFEAWKIAARVEGEEVLRDRVLYALKWQAPIFAQEGWKYAPYLERYLKRAKWEDEPPPAATAAGVIKQARSPYCVFHRAFGNNGKLPREGQQIGCPECKHSAARIVKRASEPTTFSYQPPAYIPTADELAQLREERKKASGG